MDRPDKQPPTLFYHREPIDDGFGEGLRILSSHEEVYEARTTEDWETRLYNETGTWQAKLWYPTTAVEEAYDVFIDAAESINGLQDAALDMDPEPFLDRVDMKGHARMSEEGFSVQYREAEETIEAVELSADSRVIYLLGSLVGYAGTGAAGGFLIGGPAGSIIGGVGGLSAWMTEAEIADDNIVEEAKNPKTPTPYGYKLLRDSKNKVRSWRHKRKKKKERKEYEQPGLLEDVNELHGTVARMNQNKTVEGHDRRDALREKEPQERLETALDLSFRNVEQYPGVIATGTFDTYDAATLFIGDVVDADALDAAPSIYTNVDAFSSIFELCREYGLEEDQNRLARNAHERGGDDVLDYLNEEYPELFHEHGMDYVTRGDA